jgi:hypothetical protein
MGILRTNKISGLETPTPVTGSVSFDGSGDNLSLTFTGGTGDGNFTLEYWVYHNTLTNWQTHFATSRGSTGFNVGTDASGDFVFFDGVGGLSRKIEVIGAITTNRWYHWAFVRSRGVLTGYLDGVSLGTYNTTTNYTATTCTIGSLESNDEYVNGYISNLRFLRGTALYTSNFTPPVNELQPIGDTVLLCCNNPDSAGAEATGKTITANGNAAASTFSPGLTRDLTFGTQFSGVAKFDTQGYFVPPSGTTEQRFPNFGAIESARGIFAGGNNPPVNTIDYVTISSTGNATDFGDLVGSLRWGLGACSSSTRGLFAGGYVVASFYNTIEYVTISSIGNSIDFGDLTQLTYSPGSCSSATRGLFGGGAISPSFANTDVISYVTIASTGNALSFGNLSVSRQFTRGCSSSTRGIFGAGATPTSQNVIDFVTISSLGNAQDFGDLTVSRSQPAACSNSTRGLFGGGINSPTYYNIIDYITIASTGNATDFGDLNTTPQALAATSSTTRGLFGGGNVPAGNQNVIDYVTIATTGNATDFGDLTSARRDLGACSDGHGGLG